MLAKRLSTTNAECAADEALLQAVPRTFDRELEPHFRAEERTLLSLLSAAGEIELVTRTLHEHAQLRELIRHIRAGDTASLPLFGAKLDAHVRFEERELFAVAESVLGPEALARVGRSIHLTYDGSRARSSSTSSGAESADARTSTGGESC